MTREEAIKVQKWLVNNHYLFANTSEDVKASTDMAIEALERESKIRHCKDCKWWKDYEEKGDCSMYEPKESGG